MPRIERILFRPPLAFARLGGSSTPLENFVWRDDPTIHGASQNTIEPALSFRVAEDGRLVPYTPTLLQFRDGEHLRPVAPFFELWAEVVFSGSDLKEDPSHELGSTSATVAGKPEIVPLTSRLLDRAGGHLGGVLYTIHLGNHKASRRTGEMANAFEAWQQVQADDFQPRPLLAITPPVPGQEPLVFPDRPIPLGSFQAIRPLPVLHSGANLDVLRVRYTPPRGEVYGPPTAIQAQDEATGRFFEIVPPRNRILNPKASWTRYDGSYQKFLNPEPSDTYDGADQPPNLSWGVVDDTCDGILQAEVVVQGRRLTAVARLSAGPAHFAPDRRPFLSLADDLADRDLEPATPKQLLEDEADTQDRLADLFQRAYETARLIGLDGIRSRALRDNVSPDLPNPKIDHLPYTDERSMTSKDAPYADAKVKDLIGETAPPPTPDQPLPFSQLVPLAHAQLAEQDELLDFLLNQARRVQQIIRPPYGCFAELQAKIAKDTKPDVCCRDPRILRDQAHDMRMPPYMRDELGTALGLTRRQYRELLSYVNYLAQTHGPLLERMANRRAKAEMVSSAVVPTMPLRRRIRRRLEHIRQYRRTPPEEPR